MLQQADLKKIFWLCGSTCAGKTTVSELVARQLGCSVYHCDEWESWQGRRADPERHPNWYFYSRITGDELWLRPVEEHLDLEERACNEQFELILEDLASHLRINPGPVIYDGYASPANLMPLLPCPAQAFYLVSTEDFQRRYYEQRPWIKHVLAKTSNPELAWENWMRRDAMGARKLERDLKKTILVWLAVDGSLSPEETAGRVVEHFRKAAGV